MTYVAADDRYDRMPYRRCGRSGLQLPAVSLGLWQNFGDDRPLDDAARDPAPRLRPRHHPLRPGEQLRAAVRLGRGELRPHPARRTSAPTATSWSSRRRPATTCGPGPYGEWGSRKYLLASLDQSLARMGLDYVDIFYSHRLDPDTPLEETMGALDTAVRQGKALYAGHLVLLGRAHARGGARSCASSARRCSSTSRRTRCSTAGSRTTCSTCSSERGRRLHRLLAAGAGPAHRPVPRRHPGGLARGARTVARRPTAHRREPRAGPRAERDRAAARAVARADGARLGAARPARHLGADRREQRRQLEDNVAALDRLDFADDELAEIDRYAVDSGINLWARSSAV